MTTTYVRPGVTTVSQPRIRIAAPAAATTYAVKTATPVTARTVVYRNPTTVTTARPVTTNRAVVVNPTTYAVPRIARVVVPATTLLQNPAYAAPAAEGEDPPETVEAAEGTAVDPGTELEEVTVLEAGETLQPGDIVVPGEVVTEEAAPA